MHFVSVNRREMNYLGKNGISKAGRSMCVILEGMRQTRYEVDSRGREKEASELFARNIHISRFGEA